MAHKWACRRRPQLSRAAAAFLSTALFELRGGTPNCKYLSSCPCVGCSTSSPASVIFGNQSVSIGTSTYTPITSDATSSDAKVDQCLSNVVGESFTRVAAAEARPDERLGYEYGAFQVRMHARISLHLPKLPASP